MFEDVFFGDLYLLEHFKVKYAATTKKSFGSAFFNP
jgi:hypothetical protein